MLHRFSRKALLGLLLAVAACPGVAAQESGTFRVLITKKPAASTCATQALTGRGGAVARVDCLTSGLPSFVVPGRPDFTAMSVNAAQSAGVPSLAMPPPTAPGRGETAAQVPSTSNVSDLAATAAGPADGTGSSEEGEAAAQSGADGGGNAERTLRSATIRNERGSQPPTEIQVTF